VAAEDRKPPKLSPLEQYLSEAGVEAGLTEPSPGSLFRSGARLADLARDRRASRTGDVVTIVVSDKASAISRGTTNSSRKSTSNAKVTSLARVLPAAGALPNLLNTEGERTLQGQGETSRTNELSTTLAATVTRVLPNGNLLVEGAKDISVNGERQRVTIRGIARPIDVSTANSLSSERLAFLEVRIDGKGVVNDAIQRPNFLYRLLLGWLPF
jgi:flagellar L-ring protein precursor FlgH